MVKTISHIKEREKSTIKAEKHPLKPLAIRRTFALSNESNKTSINTTIERSAKAYKLEITLDACSFALINKYTLQEAVISGSFFFYPKNQNCNPKTNKL